MTGPRILIRGLRCPIDAGVLGMRIARLLVGLVLIGLGIAFIASGNSLGTSAGVAAGAICGVPLFLLGLIVGLMGLFGGMQQQMQQQQQSVVVVPQYAPPAAYYPPPSPYPSSPPSGAQAQVPPQSPASTPAEDVGKFCPLCGSILTRRLKDSDKMLRGMTRKGFSTGFPLQEGVVSVGTTRSQGAEGLDAVHFTRNGANLPGELSFGGRFPPAPSTPLSAYRNRASAEILHDILNAIRRTHEENRRIVLSDIGRRANLPNGRLKDRLEQLLILGLISARMQLTERGQAYCADYNKFVEPFLQKYGLQSGRNEPIRVSFD